jgi:hypothetical protein
VFGGLEASSCEDANIVVIKTSPGASHQIFLDFSFNLYDCVMLVGALGLYEWINTVVTLRLTFMFIVVNPILWWNIVSSLYT